MAVSIIAEAVLRIEHKIDLLLKSIRYSETVGRMPMQFVGHQCPVCDDLVNYVVDINHSVVVRKCSCSSGKLPPTIPLVPVSTGVGNGNANSGTGEDQGSGQSSHRRRG